MALLHRATITPSKLELIEGWAPTQRWADGSTGLVVRGANRFDDPAGRVGIETLLVQAPSGPLLQVPLSYRDAPLPGGEDRLIGTMQHSVLGERWVYDGVGDPVVVAAFITAIATGAEQAEQVVEIDGAMVHRDPTATVRGTGTREIEVEIAEPVVTSGDRFDAVSAGGHRLVVRRMLDDRAGTGDLLLGGPVGEPARVLAELTE